VELLWLLKPHLLEALEEAIFSLTEFPHRISLSKVEPWQSYEIRKMPVKIFLSTF
jgi:toxin ParE1/3/4